MKTFLALLAFLMSTTLIAQTVNFTYTIKVRNTQGRPMPSVEVSAKNGVTNTVLKETTNAEGKAVFKLTEAGTYTFSYLEITNAATAEVKAGYSGTFQRSVVYDPKGVFAEKPKADRKGIVFKSIPGRQLRGQKGIAKITIHVKQKDRTLVPNVGIDLVSIKNKVKYNGKSNGAGQAIFYVPVDQKYEVDVEGLEAYQQLEVPNYEGLEMSPVVFYERTKMNEIAKGDTLVQRSITQTTGTSTHVLFTLNLNDFNGNPLPDEPVYLKSIDGPRVYEGVTDEGGKCSLMVKKGADYVLNLKHESGLMLIEAPVSKGFRREGATRSYRGSAVIEQQLAEQKAEMERLKLEMERLAAEREQMEKDIAAGKIPFEVTFHDTPVQSISEPKDYLTRTADGFNLNFKKAGTVGTPTVVGNKLFTQEGVYSSNYYCVNADNGSFNWGLRLGESGISPAVYHAGVILINTASCTLYAIDATTGKLLWSKWLAGYVYTTPTADDDNVYVAYRHGGYPVVVSFGLRSGELNWMRLVDEEIIACPVMEGNEIHVASQNGMYYVYDKKTGEMKNKRTDLNAVSSPTISNDKIFITVTNGATEHLVALDRETLKTDTDYPTSLTSLRISGVRNVDEIDQMNFNGSHPIVYQNRVVVVTDRSNVMAFDIASEKLLWKQPVQLSSDQLPIVANEKVIITSKDGLLLSFDLKTGARTLIREVPGKIEGQPIARKGILYIAVGGIVTVIKNATKHNWGQWNQDAGHNTVWK